MSETGPGKLSITERLKAKSAEDIEALESEIRTAHARLATNLKQSSKDVLNDIETSIHDQLSKMQGEINHQKSSMEAKLTGIELRPIPMIWRAATVGAISAALTVALVLGIMSMMGLSATATFKTLLANRAEAAALDEKIRQLDRVWVQDLTEGTFLIIPNADERLFTCGTPPLPCVKLSE